MPVFPFTEHVFLANVPEEHGEEQEEQDPGGVHGYIKGAALIRTNGFTSLIYGFRFPNSAEY